jgi:hypothetical protein
MSGLRRPSSPPALPQIGLATDPWSRACESHRLLLSSGAAIGQLSPTSGPASNRVSTCASARSIRLEPATSRRLLVLWLPFCLGSGLAPFALALRSHPQSGLATVPRVLPSGCALCCWFQPCGLPLSLLHNPSAAFRLAFDSRLLLALRPALWPASVRRSGLRPRAVAEADPLACLWPSVARRTCVLRLRMTLWPVSGLAPFPQPLRHRPEACSACSLRWPCGLRLSLRSNLLLPVDQRALDSPGLRPFESTLRPAPSCVRLAPSAGLKSALLVLPRRPLPAGAGSRLHSAFGVFRSRPALQLAPSIQSFRGLPDQPSAPGLRPSLPSDPPAFPPDSLSGLRLPVKPSGRLRCAPPDLRPSVHPPAPPRAWSSI